MKSRKALAFAVVAIILAIQQCMLEKIFFFSWKVSHLFRVETLKIFGISAYALKCWYCAGANVPIEIAPDKWCLDPFNATTAPKTGLDECYFGACLKVVASKFLRFSISSIWSIHILKVDYVHLFCFIWKQWKTKFYAFSGEKDVILVIRDCVFPDICSSPDIANEPSITHCSTCKTDGCNKATNFSPVILLVAISTVTSMIIRL